METIFRWIRNLCNTIYSLLLRKPSKIFKCGNVLLELSTEDFEEYNKRVEFIEESDEMESYKLFSKRNKVTEYDVFQYDLLPDKLRNQIYYIWKDALDIEVALSLPSSSYPGVIFEKIHDTLCREHGFDKLVKTSSYLSYARMCIHFLRKSDVYSNEILLDLIELSMREIDTLQKNYRSAKMSKDEAVKELNLRFRENGIGYEFSNDILIRKDSEILHEEVTKPALYLLQEDSFEGALEEFLKAHDHYRKGDYKDSILNAGKAFESTMKTIISREAWAMTGKEGTAELISLLVSNNVIPKYLTSSLQGLGTVRNKVAGHGQGEEPVAAPEYLVNYALHLCGTNIVMLIEAYKDYSK